VKRSFAFILIFLFTLSFSADLFAKKREDSVSKIIKYFKKADLDEVAQNFALGYLNLHQNRYNESKGYFLEIENKPNAVSDYVRYYLGYIDLKLGNTSSAINNFENLVSNYPDTIWLQDAYWGLANAYQAQGDNKEALSNLEKVKPDQFNGVTYSEYNFLKARVLNKASLYKSVYFDSPSNKLASKAKEALKGLGTKEARDALNYIDSLQGQIQRARSLVNQYQYEDGLAILNDLATKHRGKVIKEALADAYFRSRNYPKAKELYQELLKKGSSAHYILRLAKSAARSDDFDTAIKIYERLLKKTKKARDIALYKFKIAFLYMDSKRYRESLNGFLDLVNSGYRGHLSKNIIWDIAWLYYKLDEFDNAIEYFTKLKDGTYGKKWKARSSYWIARAYEKKGESLKAKIIYEDIIQKYKFSYYAFLSINKLTGRREISPSWKAFDNIAIPENSESFLPKDELKKALFLKGLGLKGLASRELAHLNVNDISGLSETIAIINFSKECMNFNLAYKVAMAKLKELLYEFPDRKDLRHLGWTADYPLAYSDVINDYEKELPIDKKLIFAMMREESRFQSDVISRADAIGLMQIIPPTAEKLAKELEVQDFDLKDMFRPKINIRFGMKYLLDLKDMFNGEKIYMIASYNAGEEAVSRWLKNSDVKEIEEFIEEIPYTETNGYVKKVLKTYWIYQNLY